MSVWLRMWLRMWLRSVVFQFSPNLDKICLNILWIL